MADNSKREQIIVALVTRLEGVSSIQTVRRTRPEFAEMEDIPSTWLPMVAVTAGLPQPKQKKSQRVAGGSTSDFFLSVLDVDLFCYAHGGSDPDSRISSLADDLWGRVMTSGTLGGLLIDVNMLPKTVVGVWDPYITFKLSCQLSYSHASTGI